MANSGEYKSKIGLDSLYVAAVTEDSATAYTTGATAYLAPAAEASQEPTSNFEIQYADDIPYDVMASEGETKITLSITNIDLETLAAITGRVFDSASGRMWDNTGLAPYYALSFRSLKSNGSYRYYQYLKGRFDMPKENMVTKGETPEPQLLELTFTAVQTIYEWNLGSLTDSVKRIVGDADTLNFVATGWFTSVQTPSYAAPSALAMSPSVPTDDATGISLTANQTLTFNNALVDDAVYMVSLLATVAGTVVPSSITLDATKKIVTINPTSSLGDTVDYTIIYAVEDIYGQHLAGAVTFTSASA